MGSLKEFQRQQKERSLAAATPLLTSNVREAPPERFANDDEFLTVYATLLSIDARDANRQTRTEGLPQHLPVWSAPGYPAPGGGRASRWRTRHVRADRGHQRMPDVPGTLVIFRVELTDAPGEVRAGPWRACNREQGSRV